MEVLLFDLPQTSNSFKLMYYDARPSAFNGIFDFYTYEPLKGYYAFYWYGMFYDTAKEIPSDNRIDNIYSLCGVDKDGKTLTLVTHYNDDDSAESKQIKIDLGKPGQSEIYLLDENHNGELVKTTSDLTLDMAVNSFILIKEV